MKETKPQKQEQKRTFWQRLRYKYRLTLVNEDTLQVHWHLRMSWLRAALLGNLLFLIALALCSVLILFTPIRTFLPGGVTEDERQFLLDKSMRLDSLQQVVDSQTRYLESIKSAVSGVARQDSTPPLDSMRVLEHEQLIEKKMPATEQFVQQYEAQHPTTKSQRPTTNDKRQKTKRK
ncbi:MAG: hypothetical protein II551_07485 [Paludibacteraceae bacterium]|nr:hypothetical protein [Paludibacteraceae bacterium]